MKDLVFFGFDVEGNCYVIGRELLMREMYVCLWEENVNGEEWSCFVVGFYYLFFSFICCGRKGYIYIGKIYLKGLDLYLF